MVEKSNWTRRKLSKIIFKKKTTRHRIKETLKTFRKTKKGLSCKRILSLTKGIFNFLGCFAQNVVTKLRFRSKPCFFFVNIDSTGSSGSHWIAIGLFKTTIEVFDPLGFTIFNWSQIPCSLLTFIHTHSTNRKLLISDKVQSNFSTLCGFYCLFYVLCRPYMSLKTITSFFSKNCTKNDKILSSLF